MIVSGPLPLGAFLKLAGAAATGGEAKHLVQAGEVMLNGAVETRRGHLVQPGDVVATGGVEYHACTSPS